MNALVLSGVLCCFLSADDNLTQQLDADYQALLEKEKDPQPMRDAARALEETDKGAHHWRYMDGLKIIRRTRSKAAVPLLLKYMVVHAGYGWQTMSYADTLTILTGKNITDPTRGANRDQIVHDYVELLVKNWWSPNKAAISTDPGKMSQEELETVTARLLELAEKDDRTTGAGGDQEATAGRVNQFLTYGIMSSSSAGRRAWEKEDLHPAMLPLLLRSTGYRENPPEKPEMPGRIPYSAIKMLGALRQNGQAPALDKIAEDARQTSAARLTCALALHAASEHLKTPVLLDVLEKEKDLELRLAAIIALRYSREKRTVGDKLITLLDDPNGEIRTAAVCALEGPLPPTALPKLKKVIEDGDTPQAMPFVFRVIAEYKNREACEILAGYLSAALEDRDKARNIMSALSAFSTASGKRFMVAGAQPEEVYRTQAKAAVKWWTEEGRKSFSVDDKQ